MNAGSYKWLTLFVDILTYELDHTTDNQLLTDAAHLVVDKHPILGRVLIITAGIVLTLHLSKTIHPRYDIMSKNFWNLLIKGR